MAIKLTSHPKIVARSGANRELAWRLATGHTLTQHLDTVALYVRSQHLLPQHFPYSQPFAARVVGARICDPLLVGNRQSLYENEHSQSIDIAQNLRRHAAIFVTCTTGDLRRFRWADWSLPTPLPIP